MKKILNYALLVILTMIVAIIVVGLTILFIYILSFVSKTIGLYIFIGFCGILFITTFIYVFKIFDSIIISKK